MSNEEQVTKDRGNVAVLIGSWIIGLYWIISSIGSESNMSFYAGVIAFTIIVGGTCDYFRIGGFGSSVDNSSSSIVKRAVVVIAGLGLGALLMFGLNRL
ncbi:MAG: hypothetical protein JXR97_03900 [Planctomycetes bacterium]|nr:hypothetical protein [Planctomycetota bacterium]